MAPGRTPEKLLDNPQVDHRQGRDRRRGRLNIRRLQFRRQFGRGLRRRGGHASDEFGGQFDEQLQHPTLNREADASVAHKYLPRNTGVENGPPDSAAGGKAVECKLNVRRLN